MDSLWVTKETATLVDKYCQDYGSNPTRMRRLHAMLDYDYRSAYADPGSPYPPRDEYEVRIQLARDIEKEVRKYDVVWNDMFRMDNFLWAAIMIMPLPRLKAILEKLSVRDKETAETMCDRVKKVADGLRRLVQSFLEGPNKAEKAAEKKKARSVASGSDSPSSAGSSTGRPSAKRKHDEPHHKRQLSRDSNMGAESPSAAKKVNLPKKSRDASQHKICFLRDKGRCRMSQMIHPEVCHVIPFAWTEANDTAKKMWELVTSVLRWIFEDELFEGNAKRRANWGTVMEVFTLSPEEARANLKGKPKDESSKATEEIKHVNGRIFDAGVADKAWNMLSFSPLVHTFWGKAYFGLKFYDILPVSQHAEDKSDDQHSTLKAKASITKGKGIETAPKTIVQLQLYWLPRLAGKGETGSYFKMDLSNEMDWDGSTRASLRTPQDLEKDVLFTRVPEGASLITGDIISVEMDDTEVGKFITVINIQWALIRIAAMSGAAEAKDLETGGGNMGGGSLASKASEAVDIPHWQANVVVPDPAESSPGEKPSNITRTPKTPNEPRNGRDEHQPRSHDHRDQRGAELKKKMVAPTPSRMFSSAQQQLSLDTRRSSLPRLVSGPPKPLSKERVHVSSGTSSPTHEGEGRSMDGVTRQAREQSLDSAPGPG
ncbi:hypothetical protein HIM_07885 [Hirsutella minnesotensis 3608]|uniref:HNH nuclease domain-containing protein n=1 Tax=Hirsutella minnesotensis 3608 TaxID=1043627 RepID=A0A0F7ZT89_9HYPO|nr:hypothetical protein HIM_07885 [Hirsutella minnesotensis 3608]